MLKRTTATPPHIPIHVNQGRFFQGTLPPMMPLHHQERPTPLPLQKAPPMRVVSTQAGTVSTPATPVLVYAYPHGYVVAYQQGYAGTPQKVAAPQVSRFIV